MNLYYEEEGIKIYNGDALSVLKHLPSESVDCVVTSPPYWALRDYGVEGQIGQEEHFEDYINNLCDIFDEVKRVLKKEGTCWVNIGDTYSSGANTNDAKKVDEAVGFKSKQAKGLPKKCLVQIPSRFAIEMCNRGWILRNEIIWHKENAMPTSITDRFTVDFEKIFFFVKSAEYYFEQQFEPFADSTAIRVRYAFNEGKGNIASAIKITGARHFAETFDEKLGRNKRCVWTINTQPLHEHHYAAYPETLCETPIKAGCPEQVCKKCGKGRKKVLKRIGPSTYDYFKVYEGNRRFLASEQGQKQALRAPKHLHYRPYVNEGYEDCECNAGWEPGVVLDPFLGSGTTLLVAKKLGRNGIGIELNPEYCEIAIKRVKPAIMQSRQLKMFEEGL